jgi:uncharacterized protein (TIGR00269 family)
MNFCVCGAEGEYQNQFSPHSHYYCDTCFLTLLTKKFLRGMPRVIRGHSLAIAVSGGKDSMALLHAIYSSKNTLKLKSLSVILLEEEIPEIQKERQRVMTYLQKTFPNINFIQKSYTELFQYSLPELVEKSLIKDLKYTPCTICGVLRKQTLFKIGREVGAKFIALGTNLEDEATTVLLNLIRGRGERNFIQNQIFSEYIEKGQPERIHPFSRISEDLIRDYCELSDIPTISVKCPYANFSLRSDITPFIEVLKKRDPQGSLLFNLISQKQELKGQTNKKYDLKYCDNCHDYTSDSLCPSCRILQKLVP